MSAHVVFLSYQFISTGSFANYGWIVCAGCLVIQKIKIGMIFSCFYYQNKMSKDQKCFLQKAIRIDIPQYVELFMYVVTNVNLVNVGRQQHFFILSFFLHNLNFTYPLPHLMLGMKKRLLLTYVLSHSISINSIQ